MILINKLDQGTVDKKNSCLGRHKKKIKDLLKLDRFCYRFSTLKSLYNFTVHYTLFFT
jgi:hypothetical protein